MKNLSKIILTALCLILFASISDLRAQDGFGAGVIVGEPTGISLKKWDNSKNAFDAGVAWSFRGESSHLHLHADYLIHSYGVIDVDKGQLPLYYGIGGTLLFADDPNIGARVPVGLSYLIEDQPLELFGEVAPTLNLIPETSFDMGGGIGIRYYF